MPRFFNFRDRYSPVMNTKRIGFDLQVYKDLNELEEADRKLMEQAEEARESSYSPYSKFSVGAAVLLEDGTVIKGSNQENASYPSGLCAERVAVFSAGANFPKHSISAIAIIAGSDKTRVAKPAGPCGNCRQAILEYETQQQSPIAIIMKGQSGPIYKCPAVSDLLPLSFDHTFLGDS